MESGQPRADWEDLNKTRFFRTPVDPALFRALPPDLVRVEINYALTDLEYERVANLMRDRPDVELCIFDHPGKTRDLTFLRHFGTLRRLRLACFNLKAWTGFECIPECLTHLMIDDTRWRNFSLSFLERLTRLEVLYLEGHSRDVDVLGHLHALRDLTLRSLSLKDLSFLTTMESLRSLDIKLGGTSELGQLAQLHKVNYLELWLIRGLTDISCISGMTSLERVHLEALKHVTELPDLSKNNRLRRITLQKMPGITDLRPLVNAPALQELELVDAAHLQVEDLRCLVGHPTLKHVQFGLGSWKKIIAAEDLLQLAPMPGRRTAREDKLYWAEWAKQHTGDSQQQ